LNRPTTTNRRHKGTSINTGKFRNLPVYTEILDTFHGQISALLTYHSRITIMRFDLHLPNMNFYTANEGNLVVSAFFKSIKEHLGRKRWKQHKHVIYGWTREVDENPNGHYHCFIGFKALYRHLGEISSNGCTGLWALIESCWKQTSTGHMEAITHHLVNRADPKSFDKAFFQISYLAKAKYKEFGTGETHKRYSASRLRRNQVHTLEIEFDFLAA